MKQLLLFEEMAKLKQRVETAAHGEDAKTPVLARCVTDLCDRIRMGKHRGFATWLTEDYDQKFSEDLSEAGGEVVVTLEELLQAAQLYQVRPRWSLRPNEPKPTGHQL